MARCNVPETLDNTDMKSVRKTSAEKEKAMISSDRPAEYSQSKLTQQELSELQKATHFDKKELQQWYKGNV